MKKAKDAIILSVSNRMFLQDGYKPTTMRKIAQEAEVSLGLATYFFKSKRLIAVKIMETYLRDLRSRVSAAVDAADRPLLHSASMVRLCDEFLMTPDYRVFFLECLYYDIYAESLQQLGTGSLQRITDKYHIDDNPDLILLSDNYIPPSIERILLLEKEKGNFSRISYDDIPDIVFQSSVERYAGQEEFRDQVHQATVESRGIVSQILSSMPPREAYHALLFPV